MSSTIDTNQPKKEESTTLSHSKIMIFLVSWIAVFILAAILCILITYLIDGIFLAMSTSLKSILVAFLYGLFTSVIFWLLYRFVKQRKQRVFFKFATSAVLVVAVLNTLIGVMSAGILMVSGIRHGLAGLGPADSPCYQTAADYAQRAVRATVSIGTDTDQYGTGFAVSPNGEILTAYHVVENATRVYMNTPDGKKWLSVTKTAPEYDLALLKADVSFGTYLHLSEEYKTTDEVFAVGYPSNTFTEGSASMSKGIVSRVIQSDDLELNGHEDTGSLSFVQTDAAVNGGNSGGPLVGRCGVIGLVSAKSDSLELQEYGVVSEEGISFAVSSQTIAESFDLSIYRQSFDTSGE